MIWTLLLCLVIGFCIKWVLDRKKAQRTFIDMGVPGPEPSFLTGNMKTMTRMGPFIAWDMWLKKYGKTFGCFEGAQPKLVTTDLEIAKEILIKRFNQFHYREGFFPEKPFDKHRNLLFSNGFKLWKRLRSISSPTFSGSKMKEMSPLVNRCVGNFMALLEKHSMDEKPFNIYAEYQKLTFDTIANCAFGIESDCISGDDTFLQKGRDAFLVIIKPSLFIKTMYLLKVISPTLQYYLMTVLFLLDRRASDIMEYFHGMARSVILKRQQEKSVGRIDFIQLMLNARETNLKTEEMAANLDNDISNEITERAVKAQGKGMCLEEMESQAMIFMLAGYETTSTTLGIITYELALNPDVQDTLRQEVDNFFPGECLPDYISVQKLEYMDMVIKESLRLHTPAVRAVNRKSDKACTIKGLHIPAGVSIQIYNHGIHMDPDIWGPEDPLAFVPERFNSERRRTIDPLAWIPFGAGPRNCVGMRFAILEIKIALARILKKYTIHRCAETKVPLPVQKATFRTPSEGIHVSLSKRL